MDLAPPIDITRSLLTSSNVTTAEAAWSVGTTYAIGNLVNRDTLAGKGRAWKSRINSNLANDPATDDGTRWEDMGPTLPWQMFGDSVTTQSTHADLIDVVIALPAAERLNYAWFGNLSGTSLRMIATDAIEGVIYDKTVSLVSDSGIDDWWKWFAYPIERLAEYLVSDLPPLYSGLTLEAKIAETGATVGCGAMVLGLGRSLGDTQWGVQIGRRDFTTFEDDAFGDRTVTVRGWRKTLTLTATMDNTRIDGLTRILADFRGIQALFVGSGDYASMTVWGFVKGFQIQVPGPAASFCSFEFESATQ